jgi:hypothetical protein
VGALVTPAPQVGGGPLLARLRGWFLLGAVLFCALLFAGLVHDFGQTDASAGWFTANPALAGILLGLGYACMVLYSVSRRRRRDS